MEEPFFRNMAASSLIMTPSFRDSANTGEIKIKRLYNNMIYTSHLRHDSALRITQNPLFLGNLSYF
jgi:hypothetical protein